MARPMRRALPVTSTAGRWTMIPTIPHMHREDEPASVSAALAQQIRQDIAAAGGWWPFDRFMAAALYQPGLGYYAHGGVKFGWSPESGSDFVTAPEISPLFGHTVAVQVAQVCP